MVAEYITSRHDSFSIGYFFNVLKNAYFKAYNKEKLYFRLVVVDYCFATIHAVLNSLNNEDIYDYAERVFKLASGKTGMTHEKSWLSSCAAHTMHRFTKGLKKHFSKLDEQARFFYGYIFSLMLNCKSLEGLKSYFKSLATICYSKYITADCQTEMSKMQDAIEKRPIDKVNDIISNELSNESILDYLSRTLGHNSIQIDSDDKTNEDKLEQKRKKSSIKDRSPFTSVFSEIINETKHLNETVLEEASGLALNPFYSPQFIEYITEKFMPYCFIWCSFTLHGLSITRITNGLIEKYNQFRKDKFDPNLLPHVYIDLNFKLVIGKKIFFFI